jgi:hypothetical protein
MELILNLAEELYNIRASFGFTPIQVYFLVISEVSNMQYDVLL